VIPATPLVVSTVRHTAGILTQLLGLAALSALFAVGAAIAVRQWGDQRVPRWLAVLVGLVPVVLYLGTTTALESVLREGLEPTEVEVGLFSLAGVLAGAGGALAGRWVGDLFTTAVLTWTPTQDIDGEVGSLAQTVGQVTTVTLPPSIDDAIGYDPVPERTKEALAGATFVFPRTLTTEELHERLAERLKSDYGVETVDAELDGDRVSYLAVGRRAAGIGSTLPAATNAVSLRADPAFSASTGDIVQVWEPETMRRVLTGELRGVADDVVTVAIDATDTPKVDPRKRYRLVTLPVEDRPDREFASLLRAAAETFSSAAVEAGSPLHGMPVAALDLTVVAVRPEDTEPVVFPEGSYRLAPGDRLFVIGTAPRLRYLDRAGEPLDPSVVGPPPSTPVDGQPVEAIETETVTPHDEGTSDEPARIGSETGIERDDAAEQAHADPEPTADAEPAPTADAEADSSGIEGKADETTFEEIKAEFDEQEGSADQVDAAAGEESETPAEPAGAEPAADSVDASTGGEDPVEAAAADPDEVTDVDPETASFDDLREEFESGEADWDEDEAEADDPFEDVEIAFEDDDDDEGATSGDESDQDDGEDELVSLDEAEITFEDEAEDDAEDPFEDDAEDDEEGVFEDDAEDDEEGVFEDDAEDDEEGVFEDDESAASFETEADDGETALGEPEIDEGLQGESEESLGDDLVDLDVPDEGEETDDLSDLEIEEDEDDGLFADESLEDDDVFGEGPDDEDDEDDEDDDEGEASDDDDDDGGGGGGKSFAELKEEFDSGDADWEDDVSDSPGGDMRLDE
jgi:hypothetical protein